MTNLYYISASIIISQFFYFFVKYKYVNNKYFYMIFIIKYYLLLSCFIAMLIHSMNFLFFLKSLKHNLIFNLTTEGENFFEINYHTTNISFFNSNFNLDFFGMIFLTLAFMVGLISFLVLDQQFFLDNSKFIFICNLLILIIYVMICTNNYFLFFILYELLLIPSFIFVFITSGYKKGLQAAQYFLI